MKFVLTRGILPAAILALGVFCAGVLIALGPRTAPNAGAREPLAVEAVTLRPKSHTAEVEGTGVVQADQQVVLVPEVGGRVVWVADGLRPGRQLQAGEVLARLDARDYRAALAADQARLRQAEVELALERERQVHSARQWELLGDGRDSEQAKLALRKPQLDLAQANVDSARAAVERSERNVQRTALTAPFNAVVLDESLDVGQTVGASAVATLAGTDRFRVPVSVRVEQLRLLEVPGVGGVAPGAGSPATVVQRLPTGRIVRTGRVVGLQGQLDPQTRTAVVMVAVDAPMATGEGELPLLPGAYVDVTLEGRERPGTFAVPRTALANGDEVWVVQDGHLAHREVVVDFATDDTVYVEDGLTAGDVVVTSRMSAPIVGQKVEITERPTEVGALDAR